MVRCDDYYDKVVRDGNFCGMSESSYNEVKQYIRFVRENTGISALTEDAAKPLIHEKDSEIQSKAIEAVAKNISNGNIPTAKQVKSIIENKRAGVKPGGRIQSGQDSVPEHPTLTMKDFLSVEKNEVGDSEDLERDTLQGDFSGNIESTPDEQEKPDGSDVQKQPVTTRDPEVIKTVIADRLEEKRIAQEIRDLQENKESEKHTQKDEMERDALAEDAESIRTYFDLVKTLTACFKEAIRNGLRSERVEEAISDALNIAFEARPDTPENLGITEYTKAEKDIQKLKALTEKKEKWVREDAKKEEEQ